MEYVSVLFVVISGISISSGFGRLIYGWSYDALIVATILVIFGVGLLGLIFSAKLGLIGAIVTFFLACSLNFSCLRFSLRAESNHNPSIIGCIYWLSMLLFYSIASFKISEISNSINEVYSLEIDFKVNIEYLIALILVIILLGSFSLLMFMYEFRKIMGQTGRSSY